MNIVTKILLVAVTLPFVTMIVVVMSPFIIFREVKEIYTDVFNRMNN